MHLLAFLRWLAFAFFTVLCLAAPPALLWGLPGLAVGSVLGITLLWAMRFHGTRRLCASLKARPLTRSQAPAEHALVDEFCRRLGLQVPHLMVTEAPGLNVGVFGFSPQNTYLVITRGVLDTFSRPQLAALIARALCRVWSGEVPNETWLARFFDILQTLVVADDDKSPLRSDNLALRRVVRQVLLYPLTLFPVFVLKGSPDEMELDARAARILQDPRCLTEAFRRIDAMTERLAFRAPFSCRHLFLASTPSADPLARLFFSSTSFSKRVRAVEGRMQAVSQA